MQIQTIVGKIQEQETQALVLNLFEGVTEPAGATGAVDAALGGAIRALIAAGDFRGKRNEVAVLYPVGKFPARRVLLVGLGKAEKFSVEAVRQVAATVARKARDLGVTQLHTVVHGTGIGDIEAEVAAQAVVEGTILGLYRYQELKTQLDDVRLDPETLVLVELDPAKIDAIKAGARAGQIIAEATCLARNLVNRPANIATPSRIAETAQVMADVVGLQCRIMEKPEMESLGMGALLSVNLGGGEPAKMVILEHNAGREDLPTVVLVGKGITFDSGGISIKPAQDMWKMKDDMAGAAAVIGAIGAVAQLDLPLHVVALAPLTENMPDAWASKPGDVVKSLKGLTVEIHSTDAEGRMVLIDTLTYAAQFKPEAIMDIATLTGAQAVALGSPAAAVMGDEGLIVRLRAAGNATYDRVWPLPLFEEYGEQLKTDVADVRHVGSRMGGSITAGFFLSKFVPDGVPWVHIDMAAQGIADEDRPYIPRGGTGYGVRLLVETLRRWND
ncbi:MAG: leucyl aminopeptidase [Anaerolineae bacterium]|nr:leucyl aminopeptidase [Anaerolineae bacterium]